jgi:hypothetical protein
MTRTGLVYFLFTIAAALSGCGPSLIWSGRTADRHHTVEVIERAGLQYVVVDGRRRGAYRGIAGWSIAFSQGHLAFAARVGPRWVVVHDGAPGDEWDSVGEPVLGPGGRLAYAARRMGGWYVVVDGRPGLRFDALLAGTLRFSANGRRVVYAGESQQRVHVVTDGAPGPAFDGVGQLQISADGTRVAYAARSGLDAYVVLDGRSGPRWNAVGKLVLSPAGGRAAYAALDGEGWRVVVDGEPGPTVDIVRHIAFRDDGSRVAWIARVGELDVLALDGTPVAAASTLRPPAVSFRPSAAPAPPGASPGLARVEPAPGGERVVVDDAPGPTYREIGRPVWSRAGRLAYVARDREGWVLVVDGREVSGAPADAVGDPVFSPDGRRLVYLMRRGRSSIVVADGREHVFDLALEGSLVFSANGQRWAVIAGDLAREQLFFAIEAKGGGVRHVPLPAIEIYSAAARRSPVSLLDAGMNSSTEDHDLLQAWSRAEADRAAGH